METEELTPIPGIAKNIIQDAQNAYDAILLANTKKAGRPTLYRPEMDEDLINYFSPEPLEKTTIQHYKNGQETWKEEKFDAVPIPALCKWARERGLSTRAVNYWLDPESEYHQPSFLRAYNVARSLRAAFLVDTAVLTRMAPNLAKFIMTNLTDMRDKTEVKHEAVQSFAELVQLAEHEKVKQVESKAVDALPEGETSP